jgi:hypothetical protein
VRAPSRTSGRSRWRDAVVAHYAFGVVHRRTAAGKWRTSTRTCAGSTDLVVEPPRSAGGGVCPPVRRTSSVQAARCLSMVMGAADVEQEAEPLRTTTEGLVRVGDAALDHGWEIARLELSSRRERMAEPATLRDGCPRCRDQGTTHRQRARVPSEAAGARTLLAGDVARFLRSTLRGRQRQLRSTRALHHERSLGP